MAVIRIEDPCDVRVAPFRDVHDRDLIGRSGRFMAEGEVVLRVLLSAASRCAVEAILLAENRAEKLGDALDAVKNHRPVYIAPQAVLDEVAGFHLHRGILALGIRPETSGLDALLREAPQRSAVVVVCGVGNHDNIGGVFRNAAALGASGVILDDRCCDPFYRKAIRVSVGAVLRTPMATGVDAAAALEALAAEGFDLVALTPGATTTLSGLELGDRVAIVLGSEGPGLPADLIARCQAASIPMSGGFDSLNVATAGAIALEHITGKLGLRG
ncbi:TrmH family RNA methyltransferase [Brevundimonas sp. NPDC092305]|uniref:TrmH family RNA methyltransferase n=1 Tax=Brevundimonas sp. NPDC092305 TaxID=3363957 RepID=UPI0038092A3D